MNTLTDVQVHNYTAAHPVPLLRCLKRFVESSTYNYAALFTTAAGPYTWGVPAKPSDIDQLPLLVLVGGQQVSNPWTRDRRRKHNQLTQENLRWSATCLGPEHPEPQAGYLYEYEYMTTMSCSRPESETENPQLAYVLHFDILADANAHHVLSMLGQSEFSQLPGWLAENMSVIYTKQTSPDQPQQALRYICIQAFDYRSDFNKISSTLDRLLDESPQTLASSKSRIYKIFGSVENKPWRWHIPHRRQTLSNDHG